MKNTIVIVLTILLVAFHLIFTAKAHAEVVVFNYQTTRCRAITLSENLDVTPVGITSAGCQFNLDVQARGDWVVTGGYFDTPPYGWGGDNFFTINETQDALDPDTGLIDTGKNPRPADYSFTCNQPTYTVDQGWLPAYVQLVSQSSTDGAGTSIADGKTYTFQIDPLAPVGATFDIPIRFTSDCTMIRRDDTGELSMNTVEPIFNKCQKRAPININPRTVQRNYTVTVGNSLCTALPTPLPTGIKTPTPSKTPAPTPTAEPLAAGQGWFKLKDASFHRQGRFRDYLDPDLTAYDSDDTTDMYPLIGGAGVLTANSKTIDIGSNTEDASRKRWERSLFADDNSFLNDLKTFVSYASSEKNVKVITSISQVQPNTINIFKGNATINNQSQNKIPNGIRNYILLVDGDLTLADMPGNGDIFNQQERSAAIMATGSINIYSDYTELNGIFIAQTIDLGYDPPASGTMHSTPLKINGNIITAQPMNNIQRKRTDDDTKPSLFIVFKPEMYMDLLPLLSVIVRESSQIQ